MIWIDQQPTLDRAMQQVAAEPVVAVDTEADSLHSYFDKVCLIQMSIAGEDLVIDPLKKIDLKGFGDILANRSITKVLHGADYDLRILNRDFGFTIGNLVDTMVCAQMLGYEAFGLGALLERHFGFKVDKSHQRADWAMRPLPPDMLEYATTDTRHLIELAGKLRAELEEKGRWEWAQEEFARLEAIRFTEKDGDEEPFRRLKGLTSAEPRALAVIRNLYDWRDGLARKADRPPFKIIGNDVILELGRVQPMTLAELNNVKPLSGFHRNRYGKDLIRLVGEAMALPEESLPERVASKPWLRDREIDNKVNRLKTVRDRVAKELKIDGSVVAPRHVLVAIAEGGTLDVPAMREWQKTLFGEELLAALKK